MTVSVAWIGFAGQSKTAALAALGFADSGVADQRRRSPFACAELNTGWAILTARNIDYPTASLLTRLSMSGEVIACQMDVALGYSTACHYYNGTPIWGVEHDAERGVFDLATIGRPPLAFEAVRRLALAEQMKEGGGEAMVDCVFDIPAMLAEVVTGYRHDAWWTGREILGWTAVGPKTQAAGATGKAVPRQALFGEAQAPARARRRALVQF